MASASGNSEFTSGLLGALHQFLKPEGFPKKGSNFILDSADVRLIIQLQKSTSSSADQLRFTINLGAYSKIVAVRLGYPKERIETASEPDCHWRERIGSLLPEKQDKWWKVTSDEDVRRSSQEVIDGLARYGLPALAEVDSTAKLRDLWTKGLSGGVTEMQRQDFLKALG